MYKTMGELLMHFKQKESPEQISLLLNEKEAVVLVAAWLSVKTNFSYDTILAEDAGISWELLWKDVEYSMVEWAEAANVSMLYAGKLASAIIKSRMVYPDNTINQIAQTYLQTKVINSMLKKRLQAAPKEPKKPKDDTKNKPTDTTSQEGGPK